MSDSYDKEKRGEKVGKIVRAVAGVVVLLFSIMKIIKKGGSNNGPIEKG